MKILNIYLRNKDTDRASGHYYAIQKLPNRQLYTIYRDNFRNEFTKYLYLGKRYIYIFNIYHIGNKSTFVYQSMIYT